MKITCSTRDKSNKITPEQILEELNDGCFKHGTEVFGFEPDEIKNYLYCTLHDAGDQYQFLLHAELSFDGTMEIIDNVVDPIISKYDKDAYFDMDEPGLSSAYISKKYISSATGYYDASGVYQVVLDVKDKRLARLAYEIERLLKNYFMYSPLGLHDSQLFEHVAIEPNYNENSVELEFKSAVDCEDISNYLAKCLHDDTISITFDESKISVKYLNDVAASREIEPPVPDYETELVDSSEITELIECGINGIIDIVETNNGLAVNVIAEYANDFANCNTFGLEVDSRDYVYVDNSEYGKLCIGDIDKIENDCIDVAEAQFLNIFPELTVGRYKVTGTANLVYNIAGVEENVSTNIRRRTNYYNAENAYGVINKEKSYFSNIEFEFDSSNTDITSSTVIFKADDKPSSSQKYDTTCTAYYEKVEFMIYYQQVLEESSSEEAFNTFRAQVSEIHPYDEGNYVSAIIENGKITLRDRNRKVVDINYYFTPDDMDMENTDWVQYLTAEAIKSIRKHNTNVESKMIHN